MIIDDSNASLQMLTDILDYHGYDVISFSNEKEALEPMIVSDLIFLDVPMPIIDSYEVCNCFKSDKKTGKVPIIFISCHDETDYKLNVLLPAALTILPSLFKYRKLSPGSKNTCIYAVCRKN
jgi:response regulator RpfG family c-di-GMP phosphodiesterase